VIVLAVRWYLRFSLSYRDVEELLAERGVEVDHTTVYRWVQHFTPLLAEAARPSRHAVGARWQVDETYVRVAGRWRDVSGRSISSARSSRCTFPATDYDGGTTVLRAGHRHDQGDAARGGHRPGADLPVVPEELLPGAWHRTDRYANNRVEVDHGQLKARLRPMRGLKQDRSATVIVAGHAFVQNLRGGHYELAVDESATRRLAIAWRPTRIGEVIPRGRSLSVPRVRKTQHRRPPPRLLADSGRVAAE
jgi:transposase-like protein